MSLPVGLSLRVGDKHLTREVQSLSFRKEAVGGVRSISFSLARSLADLSDLAPLAPVYVYDQRNATCYAQGRFSDPGRSADESGQRWGCVAFGPAQHASDVTTPLVYVDRSLEGWRFERIDLAGAGATFDSGVQPGSTDGAQGLLASWQDGTAVFLNSLIATRYAAIMNAGQKVARVAYLFVSGITDPNWIIDTVFSTDGNWGASNTGASNGWNALGGSRGLAVVSDFSLGRNVVDLRTVWKGGSTAVAGAGTWAWMQPVVEATRFTKSGSEITTGYSGVLLPHQVVEDLLGRLLPQFDGANASVNQTSAVSINQLAYRDGVTAEQVLEDLMQLAPAYRWYTRPAAFPGGKARFEWDIWPITVRYEATLNDGGTFPLSTQTLYNQVAVQWRDEAGRTRTEVRTRPCAILDAAGLTRKAMIDLGGEAGTQAQAQAAGDAYLIEHNVPKNGGSLKVARPIRDVITGAMVEPWEIEAGELVRVLGVEAYPDAFNASASDGQGVFRIHAVDYASDDNSATLALDSDARDTEDALVLLLNQRGRATR